jgi:hypothetical protein
MPPLSPFRPRVAIGAVSLALALATSLGAAGTAASPVHAATLRPAQVSANVPALADTVTGVVFDSLTNQPLAGAFITAEGAPVSTTSDSAGRFTLTSDVTLTRVTAFHALLDATGINALSVARPEGATRWNTVTLATPSLSTIWTSLCKLELPENDNKGVVVGATRLPDNDTRTAGATVRVQYEEILPRTGLRQIQELETETDSLGNFVVCGVPLYSEAAMIGVATAVRSAPVRIELNGLPVTRLDMVLGPADGPIDRWPTITGIVENVNGERVANARVAIAGVDSAVRTDSTGQFTIAQVPTGSRMGSVAADGYSPTMAQFDVLYEGNPTVVIALEPVLAIAGLTGVRVTERSTIRRMRTDFEERRKAAIATFVDSTDVRTAGSLPAALAEVPGLLIETATGQTDSTQYEIRGRGRSLALQSCAATVLVDEVPVTRERLYELPPEEIAAVEVYRSVSFAPPMFAEVAESDCAMVLVWTRFGLRP